MNEGTDKWTEGCIDGLMHGQVGQLMKTLSLDAWMVSLGGWRDGWTSE